MFEKIIEMSVGTYLNKFCKTPNSGPPPYKTGKPKAPPDTRIMLLFTAVKINS